MDSRFEPEYQARLNEVWPKFVNHENFDDSFIRPEILESWKRSRAAGVSLDSVKKSMLDAQALNIRINSNMHLIEVVRPYMERLYSIVKGSDFYLLFCDKDGYILDLIGDESMIFHGKNKSMLVAGANRQESIAGTNAIGTCLKLKAPIQIWGAEHYLEPHKGYACAGAPFFDSFGNILGCLNITGLAENMHPHSLGLVMSAVDGITKEINIQKAYNDIELVSAQRNSIIQSIKAGLVLLNSSGRIIQINDSALNMLNLKYENALGRNLSDFIVFDNDSELSVLDKESDHREIAIRHIHSDKPPQRFNATVTFVRESNGRRNGTVLTLNESHVINKLVNEVNGFRPKYTFDSILGTSEPVTKMLSNCMRAAQSNSNILITGESGTGKELVAQSIHSASDMADGPFVALNCAALPKSLVESELFGYEQGAFTGANKNGNPGKFELADGGTIFLDEIGDMPLDVQASLLRVIQTREILRVGGKYPKAVNVRIMAATNKNLILSVNNKTFREDLYYRLNVLNIDVPPLRMRGSDVCLLAEHFAAIYGGSDIYGNPKITIAPDTYDCLRHYSWPGNIRQLENAIERAVNITDGSVIRPEHLPREVVSGNTAESTLPSEIPGSPLPPARPVPDGIDRKSSDYIVYGLQYSHGNVTEACKYLGISRRTMYRRLNEFNINPKHYR